MNYNSFLTRDYKSMGQPPEPGKRPRVSHTHMLVLVSLITLCGFIISFFSSDAGASRNPQSEMGIKLNETALSRIYSSSSSVLQPARESTLTTSINNESLTVREEQVKEINLVTTEVKVKPGYSLSYIFKKHNLDHGDLHQLMQSDKQAKKLRNLHPGKKLLIESDMDGRLHALQYPLDRLKTLHVKKSGNDFNVSIFEKPVERRTNYSSGEIESSLFEAGKISGLSDALIMDLAGIFGWDVDFALDIRKGDHFSVLYEEQYIEGKKHNNGVILAAEFTNQGKTFRAIRYTDKSGKTSYYSPDGRSMRKAFLRTPVDFRRISSRFGNRHHPVLNRMRMHKGVDYAAPRGTPIRVSGDGKIIFKGRKGGYGKVIIVQHGSRYRTLYAHMNGYKRGMYVGKRVKQGQTIGFVGSTGRATGPHLHYEFRVNGVHRNPLTVKLPSSAPIKSVFKDDFNSHAKRILAQLDTYKPTRLASN